jgi:hypothetical protein
MDSSQDLMMDLIIGNKMRKAYENTYKILIGDETMDSLLEKASMQKGSVDQFNPVAFFINPEEKVDDTDIDTMIEYYVETEEYEKCAKLVKLKINKS